MSFRSSVVSIKCHFDQVSFRSSVVSIKCPFDQVSFRSSVVSIKCPFDEVSFRSSVLSIKCPFDEVSFRSSVLSIKCRFDQASFQLSAVFINCCSTVFFSLFKSVCCCKKDLRHCDLDQWSATCGPFSNFSWAPGYSVLQSLCGSHASRTCMVVLNA